MNILKASLTYEVVMGENKYQFVIPANAPAGEAYDVMFNFLNLVATDAKAKVDQLAASKKDEEKNEK